MCDHSTSSGQQDYVSTVRFLAGLVGIGEVGKLGSQMPEVAVRGCTLKRSTEQYLVRLGAEPEAFF